ncbi:MAG: hypothetical protein ACR2JW_09145 [Thermomicrobiales bacterium]
MNVATDPTTLDPQTAPPTPLYPAPPMVPVDFTRLDPLPPPPTKENTALIRFGTAVAMLGSVALVLSLFVVPWFFVREIAVVQPTAQAQGSGGGSTGNQMTFNGFAPRIVQRDIHDFGIVGWASSRREKRAVALVALVLLTQAAVLLGLNNYRWRLFLALAGCGALATLALALIDLERLSDLIRARIALATSPASNTVINASVLKIADARPGSGMIVLLVGAGCVLVGVLIALIGGRRGKVLAPIAQ